MFENGLWVILIHNTSAGRVKNIPSIRQMVVCDELLRLGFGLYVDALRAEGEVALFPELISERAGAKKGDVFYRIWWIYIAPLLKLLRRGQACHSARHMFDAELKELEVFDEDRADALGQAKGRGTRRRYSKAEMARLICTVR